MSIEDNIDPELSLVLNSLPPVWNSSWSLEKIQAFCKEKELEYIKNNIDISNAIYSDIISEKLTISTPDTSLPLVIRIYKNKNVTQRSPVLLWIHGGGFIVGGDINLKDPLCEEICKFCKCIVVSVNYRLAPQHPYPAALDDCYHALQWIKSKVADDLLIDTGRIAVGGMSAGGCLAAALTLRVRDQPGPAITFQALVIPVTDDRHETPSSYNITDPRLWNRQISIKAWKSYLKNVIGEPSALAVPARAIDLSGLPPAFVSVEDNDLLRDEGIIYAHRLMQSGIQTELHVYPGTFHGSLMFAANTPVSRKHIGDLLEALKKAFI